jgi:hypothetical protein
VFLSIDSNVSEIGREAPRVDGIVAPYAGVRQHLKERGLPYTVLVDHGNVVADYFEAKTTPHVFVFGKDGKLVYRGLVDDDQMEAKGDKAKHYLRDTLEQLLAGKQVEPFETTPIGCSIKRVNSGGGRPRRGRRSGGNGGD